MSFADKIIPRLGQQPDNNEWYVNAMYQSLNEYMSDIENVMTKPQFMITGITTIPGTPPITTPISAKVGQVSNKHIRLTYQEVKSAMWCGDGRMTFPNLFKLFASKLMLNFTTAYSSTVVSGTTAFTFDAITPYTTIGTSFMTEITGLGATGSLTPEIFHNTLSRYLDLAFKSIIPVTIPFVGMGLVPTGQFTGSIVIAYQQVVL